MKICWQKKLTLDWLTWIFSSTLLRRRYGFYVWQVYCTRPTYNYTYLVLQPLSVQSRVGKAFPKNLLQVQQTPLYQCIRNSCWSENEINFPDWLKRPWPFQRTLFPGDVKFQNFDFPFISIKKTEQIAYWRRFKVDIVYSKWNFSHFLLALDVMNSVLSFLSSQKIKRKNENLYLYKPSHITTIIKWITFFLNQSLLIKTNSQDI